MHVNKPKDQDLDMQSPSSTSPLPWLSQTNRTSKNLSFPTGPCKIWILTSLLSLFLLRKVLGSSLKPFSQVHWFTHQNKDRALSKSLFPLSHFLGCTRQKVQPSFPTLFHVLCFFLLPFLHGSPPSPTKTKYPSLKKKLKG